MGTDIIDRLRTTLAGVPAPSLVGVGDNVLDCYLDEDLAYPGGNALNVAAYSRLMFGGRAGFVGILGDDRFAAHLRGVLAAIDVDDTRCRVAHGANGMAFVALDADGDRRFVGSNRGGVQHGLRLKLTPDDLGYLASHTGVHTSVYSAIEAELPALAALGVAVSYDYSDDADWAVVERSAPYVGVGFFSAGRRAEPEIDALAARALAAGMGAVVVTRGSLGAIAYEAGGRTSVGIKPVEAVDALGAGDGFIAGFLAARQAGSGLDACLDVAAASGALACTFRGAFGYPVQAGEDARGQLIRRVSSA